jgi:hypothetical protein
MRRVLGAVGRFKQATRRLTLLKGSCTDWSHGGFDVRHLVRRVRLEARYYRHRRRLDFDTVALQDLGLSPERSSRHDSSGGMDLEIVLEDLRVGPDDAGLDFGSGKGCALITMARYRFGKLAGVEISEELVRTAHANLQELGLDGIRLIRCDAAEYRDLDDYNLFYFFNPFPLVVMRAVTANVDQSLARKPRTVTVIYRNPVCHSVVVANSRFRLVKEYRHGYQPIRVYRNWTDAKCH